MNEPDQAMAAFENALRHNIYSLPALTHIATLCRDREQYRLVLQRPLAWRASAV
jgi:hypothetical protein